MALTMGKAAGGDFLRLNFTSLAMCHPTPTRTTRVGTPLKGRQMVHHSFKLSLKYHRNVFYKHRTRQSKTKHHLQKSQCRKWFFLFKPQNLNKELTRPLIREGEKQGGATKTF